MKTIKEKHKWTKMRMLAPNRKKDKNFHEMLEYEYCKVCGELKD